jgi:hypothetical protein
MAVTDTVTELDTVFEHPEIPQVTTAPFCGLRYVKLVLPSPTN